MIISSLARLRRGASWARRSIAAAIFLALGSASAPAQTSFNTPEQAVDALVQAAQSGDVKGVTAVLGRDSADIVSSGDAVADAAARAKFLAAYQAKHQVVMEGERRAVLLIGQDDFPFAVPLVRNGAGWKFDAAAGRREVLARRIGRNELATIQACLAYVDAQNEYAEKDRTGAGVAAYAQRLASEPGKTDGLFWPPAQGAGQSPLGERVARAAIEDADGGPSRAPFHGYYFKVLTQQGPAAAGGAVNYVVRGTMIGGFGLIAYPAEYRKSGVMTFIVNHAGVIYQKDLGPRTAQLAQRMTSFNPDSTWTKVTVTAPPR